MQKKTTRVRFLTQKHTDINACMLPHKHRGQGIFYTSQGRSEEAAAAATTATVMTTAHNHNQIKTF